MTAPEYQADWWSNSACLSADPDLFFPISMTGLGLGQTARARAVCADCAVRTQCLDFALRSRQQHGIWGGMTVEERRRLLRRKDADAARALARAS